MAWTTPTVRATGDLITAAIWNADLVNNLLMLGPRVTGIILGNGTVNAGTGFSSVRNSAGDYTITFTTAFASSPVVTVACNTSTQVFAIVPTIGTTSITIRVFTAGGVATDSVILFTAQAPV